MTHPLTDEMILDAMASIYRWKPEYRAGADAAFCPRLEMRAAADWQLEQVLEWIRGSLYWVEDDIAHLRNAMRPQQQEDNQ